MPESLEVAAVREQGQMAINDLADYLGVTHQRVHQRSAQLPTPRQIGGRWMWAQAEIEAWADSHWWGARPWRIQPKESG